MTDLELKDLNQYYGTQEYHQVNVLLPGVKATDGVKYVMDNGYSWFVTDSLIACKMIPKLKREEFLSIKLKLMGKNGAVMIITDGNERELYVQKYSYTDAKQELHLFFVGGVVMLTGEY
jgi:hypothetical protein